MLLIKIKVKNYCSNKKWLGETIYYSDGNMDIVISEKNNTNSIEFFLTLLHELLHVWLRVVKVNGFKVNKNDENTFIYKIEKFILKLFKKELYEKNYKKTQAF